MLPYYALSTYLRQRFGKRVQKIPLDAGFTCPNRDGTLSTTGCVFCNPRGSGSGLEQQGLTLAQQWNFWATKFKHKYKTSSYIAYLQSFSNTYGPIKHLEKVLNEIAPLPGLTGLAIGTRPDCVDKEKIALIAEQKTSAMDEIWLELGLQSAHNATLQRINRGHDYAAFATATRMAAAQGLKICAHLIAGLPGETKEDYVRTIEIINSLPIHGVKFHNLYVCKGSEIAKTWQQGDYEPLTRVAFIDWLTCGLKTLRPDIVVQRLTGDAAQGELLAPNWAQDKGNLLKDIQKKLTTNNHWQGCSLLPEEPPAWFDREHVPPASLL